MSETVTVVVQRVMPAAPEVVFDEWLDPEALQEWMCPHPVRVVDVTVDARVGPYRAPLARDGRPWGLYGGATSATQPV